MLFPLEKVKNGLFAKILFFYEKRLPKYSNLLLIGYKRVVEFCKGREGWWLVRVIYLALVSKRGNCLARDVGEKHIPLFYENRGM